ncbi:hypothetical protein ENBRE01_1771 [Enteropsectra breve]|nr:hypothetical protein ENBRE01_1771 [Enteropsectra breve]
MEVTNDGFAFKRRTSTGIRPAKHTGPCASAKTTIEPMPVRGNDSLFDLDGFIFKKLGNSKDSKKKIIKSSNKNLSKKTAAKRKPVENDNINKVNTNLTVNIKKPAVQNEPIIKNKNKKNDFKIKISSSFSRDNSASNIAAPEESQFVFKKVNKRVRIEMDENIDFSTDSIGMERIENPMEDSKEIDNSINIEALSPATNTEGISLAKNIKYVSSSEAAKDAPHADKIKISKPSDIYKNLKSENVNELIKECVLFMKDGKKYSKEIVKHCECNYFSDINYDREIETAKNRTDRIEGELSKWSEIYDEKCGNLLILNEPEKETSAISAVEDNEDLVREFEEKQMKLRTGEAKLRLFFENAKETSTMLLKKVFGSMEERGTGVMFLLKAMSKLAKVEIE